MTVFTPEGSFSSLCTFCLSSRAKTRPSSSPIQARSSSIQMPQAQLSVLKRHKSGAFRFDGHTSGALALVVVDVAFFFATFFATFATFATFFATFRADGGRRGARAGG